MNLVEGEEERQRQTETNRQTENKISNVSQLVVLKIRSCLFLVCYGNLKNKQTNKHKMTRTHTGKDQRLTSRINT